MNEIMNIEKTKQFFQKDKFAMNAGAEIISVNNGDAICSMQIKEMHLNANHVVQGGAIFTLSDFTFAVASNSRGIPTVSLSHCISFLKPAKGVCLTAHAKQISSTKRTCYYEVIVTDDTEEVISHMTVNGYHPNISK